MCSKNRLKNVCNVKESVHTGHTHTQTPLPPLAPHTLLLPQSSLGWGASSLSDGTLYISTTLSACSLSPPHTHTHTHRRGSNQLHALGVCVVEEWCACVYACVCVRVCMCV